MNNGGKKKTVTGASNKRQKPLDNPLLSYYKYMVYLWISLWRKVCVLIFVFLAELGTRGNCRDNVTIFNGQPIVAHCLVAIYTVHCCDSIFILRDLRFLHVADTLTRCRVVIIAKLKIYMCAQLCFSEQSSIYGNFIILPQSKKRIKLTIWE